MIILPACIYMYQVCACCPQGQKRASNPLELGLQIVVNCHVGAGNRTLVLHKSNNALNDEPTLPPMCVFS